MNDSRIAAVVLAAGGSTRMGRLKQLIEYEGKPLVLRAVEAALAAGAVAVVVVLGARAEEIRPALEDSSGVSVTLNPDWESGLASSLRAGLAEVLDDPGLDGVMVVLADQPLVDVVALRRLITTFRGGARIVASGYDGVPGVPALFGREHGRALMGLTGDVGAGPWLRSRLPDVAIVPLEHAGLDLDTPEDLTRLAGPASFS